jgi:molybdopterin-guanine dinucleotide biosynthesis protein A
VIERHIDAISRQQRARSLSGVREVEMGVIRNFDAIVVAGGRGSRLGGIDKPALRIGDSSLLDRALGAVHEAQRVSVVRHTDDVAVDARTTRTVEQPALSGPAAAIAAGLADLERTQRRGKGPGFVAVLAADLPRVHEAFASLLRNGVSANADGLVAIDPEGREQPLLAIYRAASLRAAVAAHPTTGLGVGRLIAELRLTRIPLGAAQCADVDDEADALAAGITLSPAERWAHA